MIRLVMSGLVAAALAWCGSAEAQDGWYDPAPLVAHLREGEREGLEEQLGVRSLDALPLYDLHVAVDETLSSFGMRELLYFTNNEQAPLATLELVLPSNQVDARIRLIRGACLERACAVRAVGDARIQVDLSEPLTPGERIRVEVDVEGRFEEIESSRTNMLAQGMESLASLGGNGERSSYGLLARGDGIATMASFYPVLAPRRDGRWVLPEDAAVGDLGSDGVAHVRMRVVVPRDMRVVATGLETQSLPVREQTNRGPRREVTFIAGLVREAGIVVSPELTSTSRIVDGVQVRAWYLPAERDAGRTTLDVACSALAFFEERFGRYPYRELEVVEAPLVGGAGGVELSAMVLIASMMYRSPGMTGGAAGVGGLGAGGGVDAALLTAMLEHVTAHEVAHQWWHGLVGSDSSERPWVDESLAQWSAILWFEHAYDAQRAALEANRQVAMNYRAMRLAGIPDGAVDRPVSAFRAPVSYAGLVYGKGPFFYREVRTLLGDTAFFGAMQEYVRATRFRVGDGPVRALEAAGSARRVRALATRWLEQAHGDEDLQLGDAAAMLGDMLPPDLAQALEESPELRQMVQGMMRGLLGGSAGADSEDPTSTLLQQFGGAGGGLPSSEEIERMAQDPAAQDALEQMLGDPGQLEELLRSLPSGAP